MVRQGGFAGTYRAPSPHSVVGTTISRPYIGHASVVHPHIQRATFPTSSPSEFGRRPIPRGSTDERSDASSKYIDLMMMEIAELRALVTDLTKQVKDNEHKSILKLCPLMTKCGLRCMQDVRTCVQCTDFKTNFESSRGQAARQLHLRMYM